MYGHIEIVMLLLPYLSEADIKCKDSEAFRDACENEDVDIAQLLIDACPELEYHSSNDILKLTASFPPK